MRRLQPFEDPDRAADRLRRFFRLVFEQSDVEHQTRELIRCLQLLERRFRRIELRMCRFAVALEREDLSPDPVVLGQRETVVELAGELGA